MKSKLLALACCVFALMLLSGCFGSGGGSAGGGTGSGGVEVAGLPGGDGGGILGGGDSGVLSGGAIFEHSPEPATIALVGGGLAAYVLLRRKKK